jgi:hypothetical protein
MEIWRAAFTIKYIQGIGCDKCLDISDNLGVKEETDMDFTGEPSTRLNHKLPKVDGWVLSILLIASLLAIMGGTACQGGLPDTISVQPERGLPAVVMRGDEFLVTVTFTSPEDGFHAIGLTDVVPAGWDVSVDAAWTEPQAMVAHTPEPETAVYIWGPSEPGAYDAGVEFTAEYKVRVPVDAEPGTYTFSGSLEYYIYIESGSAASYEDEIAGDIQVTVS